MTNYCLDCNQFLKDSEEASFVYKEFICKCSVRQFRLEDFK